MTKTLKYGAADSKLGDAFETRDDKHKWIGQDAEAHSDPFMDTGTGTPVVMRFFEFKADPISFKRDNPSNQDLFNAHAQQIKLFLWKDGLEPFEAIEPKIIKGTADYKIMITCIPKKGVSVLEKTRTLQELTKPNGRD